MSSTSSSALTTSVTPTTSGQSSSESVPSTSFTTSTFSSSLAPTPKASVTSSSSSLNVESSSLLPPSHTSSSSSTSSIATSTSIATSVASPQTTKVSSLHTVEIVAIVGVGCVIIIALVALFFLFCAHNRRRRDDQIYTPADDKGRGAASSYAGSSFSSTMAKGPAYFPDRVSYSEHKGTTPLLNHGHLRNTGSFSMVESTRSQSYGIRTPTEEPSLSPLLQEQTAVQNSLPIFQAWTRRLPPLTIPSSGFGPAANRSPSRSECDSPDVSSTTESFADTDDSPSIYSQHSAYPLHLYSPSLGRGLSSASRVAKRMLPTVAEDAQSSTTIHQFQHPRQYTTESGDNRTLLDRALDRPLPPLPSFLEESSHRPITGGLDIFDFQTTSNREELGSPTGSDLGRQNTVVIVSLLKSRQQKRADQSLSAFDSSASDISHIERSGSIMVPTTSLPTVRHEAKRVIDREPYGRRYRKMKAGRDLEEQLSTAF